MVDETKRSEQLAQDDPNNAGARAAQANHNPASSIEEGRNAAAGEAPNAAGSTASSTVEDGVPGNDQPEASAIPSADKPTPDE